MPSSSIDSSHWWPGWMGHPIVNFISMVVGVVALILALFFYFKSRVDPRPFFYVEPARSIIVNRELSIGQKLKVFYDNSPISDVNISAMQCYLWNGGRGPIRAQDVLKPIKLVLSEPGAQILEASVLRQKRPDVEHFHISPDVSPTGTRSNMATIDFSILEQGDGAALQVVYIGSPTASASFEGAVVGAEIVRLVRPLDAAEVGTRKLRDKRANFWITTCVSYGLSGILLGIVNLLVKRGQSEAYIRGMLRGLFWSFLAVWVITSTGSFYYIFLSHPDIPRALVQ